jgi:hypothetical protein
MFWMERPVQRWFNVMTNMIAVVPTFVIVRRIDTSNAVLIKIPGSSLSMNECCAQFHNDAGY